MSTDIRLIIQEIEKERAYLKSEIDKAVAEGEYIEASLYEKAWKNAGQQLYILRCLQDKNFEALHHTEQLLKNSKEILKSLTEKQENSSTQDVQFYQLEINQLRKMMKRAESRKEEILSTPYSIDLDGDKILYLLDELSDDKIKSFELRSTETKSTLSIHRENKQISVT